VSFASLDLTANPNAAAIRVRRDQVIDLGANGTAAGQNLHTIAYNSTAGAHP
jgi:hypothetical protein